MSDLDIDELKGLLEEDVIDRLPWLVSISVFKTTFHQSSINMCQHVYVQIYFGTYKYEQKIQTEEDDHLLLLSSIIGNIWICMYVIYDYITIFCLMRVCVCYESVEQWSKSSIYSFE